MLPLAACYVRSEPVGQLLGVNDVGPPQLVVDAEVAIARDPGGEVTDSARRKKAAQRPRRHPAQRDIAKIEHVLRGQQEPDIEPCGKLFPGSETPRRRLVAAD